MGRGNQIFYRLRPQRLVAEHFLQQRFDIQYFTSLGDQSPGEIVMLLFHLLKERDILEEHRIKILGSQ